MLIVIYDLCIIFYTYLYYFLRCAVIIFNYRIYSTLLEFTFTYEEFIYVFVDYLHFVLFNNIHVFNDKNYVEIV